MRLGDVKVGQKVRRVFNDYGPQDIGVIRKVTLNTQVITVFYPITGEWESYPGNLELVEDVSPTPQKNLLPTDATERKKYPVATGVLDYFPSAILQVAYVSYLGNVQHNPGQPLHWARGKSTDQEDTTIRHFMERTESRDNNITNHLTKDSDGTYHLAKAIWRMLATFQVALEAEGAPLARGARLPEEKK